MALELKRVVVTNLIRVRKLSRYSHYFLLFIISNKMEHFSYKGGCDVHGHTHIKLFERRAALDYR